MTLSFLNFSDEESVYEVMKSIPLGHNNTLPRVFSPTSSLTESPTQTAKHLLSTEHQSDDESDYMFMSPATLNQSKKVYLHLTNSVIICIMCSIAVAMNGGLT